MGGCRAVLLLSDTFSLGIGGQVWSWGLCVSLRPSTLTQYISRGPWGSFHT